MKKPRGENHKTPAHTEGSKDEFSKLEQQYDSASIEARDLLHPDFIQAIRKKQPGLVEETWRALRSGDSLKATLHLSMKRVLDRNDLSVGRKTNAREDADSVMWLFDELLREDLEPDEMRGHARELATRTLFIGLRARLSPEEVEGLYARFLSDRQRTFGNTSKKERPQRVHAKELAGEIVKENPGVSYAEIVEEISEPLEARERRLFLGSLARGARSTMVSRRKPEVGPAANLSVAAISPMSFLIFFGRKPASTCS